MKNLIEKKKGDRILHSDELSHLRSRRPEGPLSLHSEVKEEMMQNLHVLRGDFERAQEERIRSLLLVELARDKKDPFVECEKNISQL